MSLGGWHFQLRFWESLLFLTFANITVKLETRTIVKIGRYETITFKDKFKKLMPTW